MTSVAVMKKVVEQLRNETTVERMKVSVAAQELMDYTEKYGPVDMLLTGKPHTGENPFREKSRCVIF